MQCQKRRVYGLCRLSVSVSAGEGDTLTKYDNIRYILTTFFYKQAKLHTITETPILSRKTRILSRKLPTFA